MKIIRGTSVMNVMLFKANEFAERTLLKIIKQGKAKVLDKALEEKYPDGLTELELNNVLWYDSEWCYNVCRMRTEGQTMVELAIVKDELKKARQDIEKVKSQSEREKIFQNITFLEKWINRLEDELKTY